MLPGTAKVTCPDDRIIDALRAGTLGYLNEPVARRELVTSLLAVFERWLPALGHVSDLPLKPVRLGQSSRPGIQADGPSTFHRDGINTPATSHRGTALGRRGHNRL
jgi:hypothetical protein